MTYGLTVENERLILEKAITKKDGTYRFRGVAYRVHQGNVTHFAANGKILQRAFGFNVIVGECGTLSEYAQKDLKNLKDT